MSTDTALGTKHARPLGASVRGSACVWSVFRAAALALSLLGATGASAVAAVWTCHGAKPGHPTAEERVSFIREVSELAVKAEKKHGVPASALAAIAIAESSYGWTRPALEANNLFAWKAGRAAAAAGKLYVPPCERRRGARSGFLVFASRAEAFDYVAARLATIAAYREHTDAYRAARKRGDSAHAAVDAWLSAIAGRYSSRPRRFAKKIRRIMNDPVVPSDTLSPSTNLYRLSAGARAGR